jgi:SAM-dependent methyltransferase
MVRPRKLVILLGAAAAAAVVLRHGRNAASGHRVPGGILIGDAAVYDTMSRLLLGPFLGRIATDIAAAAPDGTQVLEVGCGPGQLSLRLVRQHGLEVTGLDLDAAMIVRARANAVRPGTAGQRRPSFLVGDAAALNFPDQSFDFVVSTLSMHHWADPRPGWPRSAACCAPAPGRSSGDFRPGVRPHPFGPRHTYLPDPVEHTRSSPLRVANTTPWRWPWRFNLTQRIELVRADGSPGHSPIVHVSSAGAA